MVKIACFLLGYGKGRFVNLRPWIRSLLLAGPDAGKEGELRGTKILNTGTVG
jgi:hypothetical protein